jgi:hypothetical protein
MSSKVDCPPRRPFSYSLPHLALRRLCSFDYRLACFTPHASYLISILSFTVASPDPFNLASLSF